MCKFNNEDLYSLILGQSIHQVAEFCILTMISFFSLALSVVNKHICTVLFYSSPRDFLGFFMNMKIEKHRLQGWKL